MTLAKIEISVGSITFSGEGNEDWPEKQLDKLRKSAPSLASATQAPANPAAPGQFHPASDPGRLPAFLQKKGATANQTKLFLATAEWLHAKGSNRITTADVSRALSVADQKRLGNPSDALNKNVTKGHAEKEGKSFYVTPDGRASLG